MKSVSYFELISNQETDFSQFLTTNSEVIDGTHHFNRDWFPMPAIYKNQNFCICFICIFILVLPFIFTVVTVIAIVIHFINQINQRKFYEPPTLPRNH